MLKKDNYLKNEYYNFIESLPRLSQEEIVELYNSENIPFTDLDLEIKEVEENLENDIFCEELGEKLKELTDKKKGDVAYRYYLTILGRKYNVRRYPSLELRNKIVEGNMYLVDINAKIVSKLENNKLSFDDLFQYGTEALVSAAHYYVPGGEAKFSTYASKCIKNKILREMNDSQRMGKRPYKIQNFFERERLKIKELELFLDTLRISFKQDNENMNDNLFIHRLNKRIIAYNRNKDKRGEHNLKIKKAYGKTLDEIFERYSKMLKSSKLNALITDQERHDIESFLAYKKIDGERLGYYRSKSYVDLYKYKLDLLEKYINAENLLIERKEEASLENILKVMNTEIRKNNKKISELKKEGFFDKCESEYMQNDKFVYNSLVSFYEEYLEMYDIDLFEEDGYPNSKSIERDNILEEYDELFEEYNHSIKELSRIESEEVYIYLDCEKKIVDIESYIPFDKLSEVERKKYLDEDEYYFNQGCGDFEEFYRISREELAEQLTRKLNELGSEDDYVKRILKERAAIVNESLALKNRPIIEENMRIKELEDLYNIGKKYHKYLKERDMKVICENINLLYENDTDLVDLLLEKDKSKSRRLSVEEEVIDRIFMEDYKKSLKDLSTLEKEIMELYYDDTGSNPFTLLEVADILGISLSKVKKEKAKALKKLRNNKKLLSYNDED